jgi:dihydroxyacid dehydratase/phosphogluconate dehydratase
VRLTPTFAADLSDETPHLVDINPARDRSFFTLAVEKAAGTHSGLDSTMKQLLAMRLIDDAPTLTGRWSERLADAKDPNDQILYRTPLRPTSGIVEVRGNFTDSAVFKRAGMSPQAFEQFDGKVSIAVAYLGEAEAQLELFKGTVLARLEGAIAPAMVRALARANFGEAARALDDVGDAALLTTAAQQKLLRILVVIIGEGPKANGIPEMFYPSEYLNRDPVLRHVAMMITDGRYSGATYGPCLGHASPEALEGGGIGALRTGDLVFMDTRARRIDVLDAEASLAGAEFRVVPLAGEALRSRPELATRVAWLQERRRNIPATIRILLDGTLTCREGVVPSGLEVQETW